jgi:thiamine-phosphate pyrophosphorylase
MDKQIARIIDANFNRAREALRVMEDYARFVLNDGGGSERIKTLRHELAGVIRRLPMSELLAARDTPGDVGTGISSETERTRSSAEEVFTAAAKRLPEALRTLEEYGKLIDASVAAGLEQLRYRSYELEQSLVMRGARRGSFGQVQLYVLITERLCRKDWLTTAKEAIEGGAGCLQLREKTLADGELLKRARQLADLCRAKNALSIINDRPDIAALSGADGVHLGQEDLSPAEVRRIVGPARLIGISTHTVEQLRAALEADVDYIAVGPMFSSETKPGLEIADPALLETALSKTNLPVVAIGGIDGKNADVLRRHGAGCICVCSAVIQAEDIRAAARRLSTG